MTEAEALSVKGIREIKKGGTPSGRYEMTLDHPALPKRITRNFDSKLEAGRYKLRRIAELNAGLVRPELTRAPLASPHLSFILRSYLNADTAKIAVSDRPMVEWLQENLTGTLADVRTTWVDAWVRRMKREERLAPGTIRKRVSTRVVVPLLPTESGPAPAQCLNPGFAVDGHMVWMYTQFMAAIPAGELSASVARLDHEREAILSAIDFLHQGW